MKRIQPWRYSSKSYLLYKEIKNLIHGRVPLKKCVVVFLCLTHKSPLEKSESGTLVFVFVFCFHKFNKTRTINKSFSLFPAVTF